MTTQHTPGPWNVGSRYPTRILSKNIPGAYIANTAPIADDETSPLPEQIANARLIAAAPAMLAALKEALRYLDANDVASAVTILNAQGRPTVAQVEG